MEIPTVIRIDICRLVRDEIVEGFKSIRDGIRKEAVGEYIIKSKRLKDAAALFSNLNCNEIK
ncbi:hypothetical protein LCGC14_0223400 [marine sediment metagenome]|uniref:Uncharacterized protein n=1 Tax=marine sediment metagenome TaxID=412755 RepID=A0A0F9UTC5_9ZZZZ|nr:hypothetical protein [bacterium]